MFAGFQPVQVALNGIDFAIVGNVAEGLSEFPGWKGIGCKPGVDQSERARHPFVAQIREIAAELVTGELTFIYDRFVGQRGDIKP